MGISDEKVKPDFTRAIQYVFGLPANQVTLTAILPDGGGPTLTQTFPKSADSRVKAMAWVRDQNATRNLYYQDCSLASRNKRPTKEDVNLIHCAHIDVDVKGKLSPAEHAEALAALVAKLKRYQPTPQNIICTGNGVQGFWFLDTPLTATPENIDRIERINKRLALDLDGDACHDVSHLMRLPFTVNHPKKSKRDLGRVKCTSYVVNADYDSDLDCCRIAGLPTLEATADQTSGSDADDIPETVNLDRLNDPELAKLITDGPIPDSYPSRSEFTYHMAVAMRERGFSDDEIISVITTPDYAAAEHILDQHQRDRDDQAARIIADMDKKGIKPPFVDDQDDESDEGDPDYEDKLNRRAAAQKEYKKLPKERRYTIPELCNEWVWIATLKRYCNRLDPEYALDKDGFNDRFHYLKGESTTITRRLMGRTENTIPKLKGIVYRPNAPEFTDDGYWNGWQPSPVVAAAGDTKLFHAHLAYLFPDSEAQARILNWLAGVLQNPATKPRHQLFIHGRIQRTGKTFLARLMRELLGHSNCQMLTQDILENGFTGWAMRTKLVWIEEVRDLTTSKKATSKLHSWASESTITINQKNLPTFAMDQAIAFMIFSNKLDALSLDNSDGRYDVERTDVGVHKCGAPYYSAIYGDHGVGGILNDPAALGAILHELLHRQLGGYSIEQAAPFTTAKADMIETGNSPHLSWMIEHDGAAPMRYEVKALSEIVEAMPRYLQTLGASKAVKEAMRDHFHGVPWETQIQPEGRKGDKIRVWLTGDIAKLALAHNVSSTRVRNLYLFERSKAGEAAAATAGDDFGE